MAENKKMSEKVQELWEGTVASQHEEPNRKTLENTSEFERQIHAYGRSQCRTTHKRKDC